MDKLVWKDRYQWGNEKDWEDTARRVGLAIANVSGNFGDTIRKFTEDIVKMKFIPGGRILYLVGTDRKGTLYNCLTLPRPEDSMEGIMTRASEIALALKSGAGIGIRLDSLRPKGSIVKSSNGKSSGSVAFGNIYDCIVGVVNQGGSRRGALLMGHRINHDDAPEFITIKTKDVWHNTNITVYVDEGELEEYDDRFKLICEAAWKCGDPGVFFLHNMRKYYRCPLPFEGVNACSEVLLPAYGVCLLGSLVLPNIEDSELEHIVKAAIFFLYFCHVYALKNDAFPLPQCKDVVMKTAKVGLGVMGLANWLVQRELRYGSDEALEAVDKLFARIRKAADEANESLYTALVGHDDMPGVFSDNRCCADLLSCPPTGTTSLIAGVSNGIEPFFALEYERHDRIGKRTIKMVDDRLLRTKPDFLVTAHDIHPIDRVRMQATIQKHLDNAISSTVNLPHDATISQIEEIYRKAEELGCVSITVFRDGCKPGVLRKNPAESDELPSIRYCYNFGDKKLYVTVGGEDSPVEVFVSGVGTVTPWTQAATYMASKLLQLGYNPDKLASKLWQITSETVAFSAGKMIPSQPAAIGDALLRFMKKQIPSKKCKNCGHEVTTIGRCETCPNCGYSTCE